MHTQFHLAFQVHDLSEARAFYGGMLGCLEGRSTDTWVDFDFLVTRFHCILANHFLSPIQAKSGTIWFQCRILD